MEAEPTDTIEIFICYAREDEDYRKSLEKQLRVLKRQHLINVWHDREIAPGMEWQQEIDSHLNAANVILLLVSPDFMDSDYCYGIEMVKAMERHERREAYVIPIIIRPIYWEKAPFGKLQALPRDGVPVSSHTWHSLDEAFFNVAEGIRKVIESIQEEHQLKLREQLRQAEEERQRKHREEQLRQAEEKRQRKLREQLRQEEEERQRKLREEQVHPTMDYSAKPIYTLKSKNEYDLAKLTKKISNSSLLFSSGCFIFVVEVALVITSMIMSWGGLPFILILSLLIITFISSIFTLVQSDRLEKRKAELEKSLKTITNP